MTDARVPERYLMDRHVMRLSDAAFRSFIVATVWSVSNRTDGIVTSDDLALIPKFNVASVGELISSGLWVDRGPAWVIRDFESTQTSRHELEVLDNVRRRDREKKARQRAAKSAAVSFPRDDPGELSPGTGEEGQEGQALKNEGEEEKDYWPVAPIPINRGAAS